MTNYMCMTRAKVIREFRSVSLTALKVRVIKSDLKSASTTYEVLTDTPYSNIFKVLGRLQLMVGFLWHEDINMSSIEILPTAGRKSFIIRFSLCLLTSHASHEQKFNQYKRSIQAPCYVSLPERRNNG